MTLHTVALELVPPNVEDGRERALEDAHKVVKAIRDAQPKATVEELVKEALKAL